MPERVRVNETKKPERVPVADKPERAPVTTETPEVDEATWGEAVKGSTVGLPASFAKEIWNTVKGVPGLPAIALGLTQEIYGSKEVPPMRGRVRGAGLSKERMAELEKSIYDFDMEDYADQFPIMNAIIQDYADRYGGIEELKRTLRDEPASILADIVTLLVPLAKAGKLGKFSTAAAKYAPYLDPASAPEAIVKGAKAGTQAGVDKIVGARAKKYQEGFNPEVDKTGKTVLEHAEEAGLAEEDVPAMMLTDVAKTRRREGVQYRSEDQEIATRVRNRFEKSEEAIQNRGREIGGFTDAEGVDIEQAGRILLEDLDAVQDGFRGDFKDKFNDIKGVISDVEVPQRGFDMPYFDDLGQEVYVDFVPEPYANYFRNTIDTLEFLRKADSKLLPSSELNKIKGIFGSVFDEVAKGGFTLNDVDRLRTNFRRELEIAVNNGDISPVGAGEVSTKIYAALTNDFYNILEEIVSDNPDDFPPNFVDSIKVAKAEYADVQANLDTEGVKYLLRNQYKPTQVVNHILTKMETGEIDNIKKTLTDEGWQNLQPALISSILDRSLRAGDWSPGGLKKTLSSLGTRRLNYLFGEEKTKQLQDLAAFSDRFSRRNFLTSDALNDVVNRNSLEEFGWKVAGVLGSGAMYGIGGTKAAGATLAAFIVRQIGTKKFEKFINSPEGRTWMTRGDWELNIRIPGEEFIKIVPQDLRRALAYTAMTTERATERQEQKQATTNYNRRRGFGGGTGFRSIQTPVE